MLKKLAGWWRRLRGLPEPAALDPIELLRAGLQPCPLCGRPTPWSPAPPTPPGASHPHLRCQHCHRIIG